MMKLKLCLLVVPRPAVADTAISLPP